MMDKDTRAARAFWGAVRRFAEKARTWDGNVIWYMTKPDEVRDPTLISERVYGRRDEYLTVLAAAGIDTVESVIPPMMLALPSEDALYAIKRRTGFESREDYREDFAPVWET